MGIAALKGSSKANASYLNDQAAPIPALGKVMQGMVDSSQVDAAYGDAAAQNTQATDQHLPHHTDPIISLIAKNDLSLTARQSMQFNAGETLNILNAADSQHTTGGTWRIHSGQAIGITAGGMNRNETAGMQLITAQGDTTIQAHNDSISLKAKNNLDMKSAQASIDFAAATDITLRTAGGASIKIAGGNITVQCPGKILVQAGQKSFTGGTKAGYVLPVLPVNSPPKVKAAQLVVLADDEGYVLKNRPCRIWMADGKCLEGVTDKNGATSLLVAESEKIANIQILKRQV